MTLLSSPHTHTTYCDGRDTADAMAAAAYQKGFVSLGFSEHAKQRFDPRCAMTEDAERRYMRHVADLKAQYAGRMRVWLGMERDLYACADRAGYDYVIGSVHYLPAADGFVAVDGPRDRLFALRDTAFCGDGLAMALAYFEAVARYMLSYRPEICGHFDLIQKHNRDGGLLGGDSAAYRKMALRSLEDVHKSGAVLEVNTGGMARYGAVNPYPAPFLLGAWREMGGEVILSSDCHHAADIDAFYQPALALLRGMGFERAVILGRGEALFERTGIRGDEGLGIRD